MEKPQRSEQTPTATGDIPSYVLDDLSSRFIVNLPDEAQRDLIRVFFAIEQAHWFYLDFYCTERPELKTCGIKEFSLHIMRHVLFLHKHVAEHEKRFEEWRAYKMAVPTYGAILLTPDYKHCLLVQGFWTKSSWGFPKGKVDEGEMPSICAIREVYEETGLDVSKLINPSAYEEAKINEQMVRLFVIPGIPHDTKFQPQSRKEIRELKWFPVDALPTHKRDTTTKIQLGMGANNFFMVIPFIRSLRRRIAQETGNKPYQDYSASEFSGKGRGGKGDEGQDGKQRRFQNRPGPQGDASATRELRGRGQVARNLADKLSAKKSGSQTDPQSKQYQILSRGGGSSGNPKKDTEGKSGKGKAKGGDRQQIIGKLRLDEFHSKALLNFTFDLDEIMACLKW